MKAVKKHTNYKWKLLYIKRWLKVPFEKSSGELVTREIGVPQGGLISPYLLIFLCAIHLIGG